MQLIGLPISPAELLPIIGKDRLHRAAILSIRKAARRCATAPPPSRAILGMLEDEGDAAIGIERELR